MKSSKSKSLSLIVTILAGGLTFSSLSSYGEDAAKAKKIPGNLVANGDFEEVNEKTSTPEEWLPANTASKKSGVILATTDAEGAPLGSHYLSLSPGAGNKAIIVSKERLSLATDVPHELIVWVRGTGTFRLMIPQYKTEYGTKFKFVSSTGLLTMTQATPEWTRYVVPYQQPDGIAQISIALQSLGDVQFDNVWFGPKK